MRRLRSLVAGLPADSAFRRAFTPRVAEPPVLPPPMRRGRSSAKLIRQFGGRVIEVPREDTG